MSRLKDKLNELNISQSSPHARNNPWVIAWTVGLGSAVLINLIMIGLAFISNPGLVDEDYYETGRKYEQNAIKMMTAREALQWQVQLGLPEAIRMQTPTDIHFTVVDNRGVPLHDAKVELISFRPSDSDADFTTPMEQVVPGLFGATLSFPLKGIWDLNFIVSHYEDKLEYSKRIAVMEL